jgi:predicted aldo/keto reductase-like oxidoreductase
MEKSIEKKKLPEWASWSDIEAIADITGYSKSAVYMMLVGDRNIEPIEDAVKVYRKGVEKLEKDKNKLVKGLKEQFQTT